MALSRAAEQSPLDPVNLRGLAWVEIRRSESILGPDVHAQSIHRAVSCLEKALLLTPDSPDILNGWSRAYMLTGEYAKADELLTRSLALDSNYKVTYALIGELCVRQGQLEDALKHFTRAVILNPADLEVRNNRATALRLLGRDSEAIKESQAILSLAPDDLSTLQRLVLLYESGGNIPKALEYAERAYVLLPPTERSKLEQRIARLKAEMG